MAAPAWASVSEKDVMIAVLSEIRILNDMVAEANGLRDDLDQRRADQALSFPLLNTILQPTG